MALIAALISLLLLCRSLTLHLPFQGDFKARIMGSVGTSRDIVRGIGILGILSSLSHRRESLNRPIYEGAARRISKWVNGRRDRGG